MNIDFGPPVFGLVNEILALIFIMVSVIGWIIRTVQGTNQQMPPPVQRPGRRREERANDEIDTFLQQMNRNQDPQKSPAAARQSGNRPRPPGNRNQTPVSQRPAAKQQQPPPEPASSRRIREEGASRPLAGSNLGSDVAQHVRERMGEHLAKDAQRDVGQDVKDSVQKHLGAGSRQVAGSGTPTRATTEELFGAKGTGTAADGCCTTRAETLKQMLRNPNSIRQAIIIQEVLNRPKCLR